MSMLFAATYPQRVRALVLYGTYAKRTNPDDDYPWVETWEERQAYADAVEREWGVEADMTRMAPNADESLARWWMARARASASPAAAKALILMNSLIDVRNILASIQAKTMVLHRRDDRDSKVEEGRYLAAHIPGARFVELPGETHVPWWDADDLIDEIEEFLTGVRPTRLENRVLATTLFTDIVGSTTKATEFGDQAWARLLNRHHELVRREIDVFAGEEIDTAGDGFFALFDGPARAIRCAIAARDAVRELGLEIRAGVHTGEIERAPGGSPRGIAVHTGARVASLADAGEILVTSTTGDLVAGSGLEFIDRGEMDLKGVGKRRVYAVRA
jgi:class 3 adenylate cyclase